MWRFRSLAPRLGRCGLDFATLPAPIGAFSLAPRLVRLGLELAMPTSSGDAGEFYIREHHWCPAGGGLWGYA